MKNAIVGQSITVCTRLEVIQYMKLSLPLEEDGECDRMLMIFAFS